MDRDVQPVSLSAENSGLSPIAASNLLNKNSWETLIESKDLFFKVLKLGRVRGVVSIVDVPNSGSRDDSEHIQLTRELINRDVLVTISSCETVDINRAGMTGPDVFQSAGYGLAEFCDFLGIQPVLYIDSTIDKTGILDFYNGLAQHAAVQTSDLPVAAIAPGRYRERTESPGAIFTMEDDPVETADLVDRYLHDRRLGIEWCDRFDCRYSHFS